MITPKTGLLRSTITVLLLTLLAAGMAACNGAKSSDNAEAGNSQMAADTSNASTSNHAAASPEQKAAWKQKREAVRKQVEAVLTPDQVKELEAKLQQGEKMRRAVSSLNLTPEQKTKIDGIFKTAYAHREKPASDSTANTSQ